MQMLVRAALTALLGVPLVTSCASAPEPAAPHAANVRKPGKPGRKVVHAAAPKDAVRPSEHEAVIDEQADPEAKALFEKRLAERALPFARASSPPRVTSIALSDTARGEAPGMHALEPISEVTLKEGQRASMPVSLEPGACATFIAQGGLGVVEIDLFLVPADRKNDAEMLAEDLGVGPIAVIGGRGRCFKNPGDTKLFAELHAMMRRGSGVVLVSGYRKTR